MAQGDAGTCAPVPVIAGDDNRPFFKFRERLPITPKLAGTFPDHGRVLHQGKIPGRKGREIS